MVLPRALSKAESNIKKAQDKGSLDLLMKIVEHREAPNIMERGVSNMEGRVKQGAKESKRSLDAIPRV